jgi:type III secretion protein V
MNTKWFSDLPNRADYALALILFAIVAVLVVPLAPRLLDMLVVISLAMGLGLLLVATRLRSQIELLTFPALLLVSTLYRLSLNVASTKMILLEGQAGGVIEAVGRVIVGGNLLAGICVFLIVALVQFIVVAKGAERVAEVAARFSLDAMPGKQMSIDAELRAGTMTAEQGQLRRQSLDIESRLFGSMDGAMKFVKGDAIVGLVIAFVNIFGGLASGVFYKGMGLSQALHHYTTLSIGDALVSQVPSLLVAVAAGLVITRVTSLGSGTTSLAGQIAGDLRGHPVVLVQVGVACMALGLVPSLPAAVLLPFGCLLTGLGLWMRRTSRPKPAPQQDPWSTPMPAFARTGAKDIPLLLTRHDEAFDAGLLLRLTPDVMALLDAVKLDRALRDARDRLQTAGHIGFPGMRLAMARADADSVTARNIAVSIQGVPWCSFEWPTQGLNAASFNPLRPPHNGLPGYRRVAPGDTGLPPALEQVIAGVIECACRQQAHGLVSMELLHNLMLVIRRDRPKLVEELAPNIPLPRLAEIVSALVAEGLTLKCLPGILDALLTMLPLDKSIPEAVEQLLVKLAPMRCAEPAGGVLRVALVGESAAQALSPRGRHGFASQSRGFVELREQLQALAQQSDERARIDLLCNSDIRMTLSTLARGIDPRFRVFGHDGVADNTTVEVLSTIEVALEHPPDEAGLDDGLWSAGRSTSLHGDYDSVRNKSGRNGTHAGERRRQSELGPGRQNPSSPTGLAPRLAGP